MPDPWENDPVAQAPTAPAPITETGDDYLKKYVTPNLQPVVKSIVEGRSPYPQGFLMKTPYGQALVNHAQHYDPTFSAENYPTYLSLDKSYRGGGEGFRQLRAANTAITHAIPLLKATDALGNFDTLPAINTPYNTIRGQVSKDYQTARSNFEANAEPFVRELDFALTGKSTLGGQAEIRKLLDPDASGVVNKTSIIRLLSLLQGRVHEHESAYASGRRSVSLPLEALSPHNRAALDQLVQSGDAKMPEGQPAAPQAQAQPQSPAGPRRTSTGIQWSIAP
jgi:hypothetical protein